MILFACAEGSQSVHFAHVRGHFFASRGHLSNMTSRHDQIVKAIISIIMKGIHESKFDSIY